VLDNESNTNVGLTSCVITPDGIYCKRNESLVTLRETRICASKNRSESKKWNHNAKFTRRQH